MIEKSSEIRIKRGNSWRGRLLSEMLKYDDGSAYVIPVGATVLFTVKTLQDSANDDSNALIAKEFISIPELDANETNIPEGTYRYDIKIISGTDTKNTESGDFIIEKRVGIRTI